MRIKMVTTACAVAVALIGSAGVARAVSDGNYSPSQQGCTGSADLSDSASTTESGCHSAQVAVADGSGRRYVAAGTDQTADGTNVHSGSASVASCTVSADAGVTNGDAPAAPEQSGCDSATPPPAPDPTGAHFYFGADDNLDSGEHDSSDYSQTGPSDGGGIQLNVAPATFVTWLAALSTGNVAYVLTHPVPVVDAGVGACADGLCLDATTQRRMIYDGEAKGSRDAADYDGKHWDPSTCAGPSDTKDDCDGHDLGWWNKQDGDVYAEPGVQVYEDPDPQGSPEDPLTLAGVTDQPAAYPVPSAYAGTCGVTAGGGPVTAPASPVTNGAGQVSVSTGC